MNNERWLLPEGIEEVLPPQAAQLEALRRVLLDMYQSWGYDLVMPPLIEYVESLLIGTADDLDLQTFKLTDQLNGRMMGVRADMTPQVARIDAHLLKRNTPTRLCYLGTVLHTRPNGFAGSRSPLQVGAELYGHSGVASDIEVVELMVATFRRCGISNLYVDLGHVGIFRGLVAQAMLEAEQESALFNALQRKAKPEIKGMLTDWSLSPSLTAMLLALADLNGGDEVFSVATKVLQNASDDVVAALSELQQIANTLRQRLPNLDLHYDLAELRGYHYHTGVVFAAFVPGQGQAIAQGGRYDGIGKVFGNARPATGFSSDLHTLMEFAAVTTGTASAIFASNTNDAALRDVITALRAQGERVVIELPGQQGSAKEMGCNRRLVLRDNQWIIEKI